MAEKTLRLLKLLFWLLLGGALVGFALLNKGVVVLDLGPFIGALETRLFVVLFIGIFIGIGLSAAVTSWLRLKAFTGRRKAERQNKDLANQVNALEEDALKNATEKSNKLIDEHTRYE